MSDRDTLMDEKHRMGLELQSEERFRTTERDRAALLPQLYALEMAVAGQTEGIFGGRGAKFEWTGRLRSTRSLTAGVGEKQKLLDAIVEFICDIDIRFLVESHEVWSVQLTGTISIATIASCYALVTV